MGFVEQLLKWWKKRNDPFEKTRREEIKKAEKMAKFLDCNRQVDQRDGKK